MSDLRFTASSSAPVGYGNSLTAHQEQPLLHTTSSQTTAFPHLMLAPSSSLNSAQQTFQFYPQTSLQPSFVSNPQLMPGPYPHQPQYTSSAAPSLMVPHMNPMMAGGYCPSPWQPQQHQLQYGHQPNPRFPPRQTNGRNVHDELHNVCRFYPYHSIIHMSSLVPPTAPPVRVFVQMFAIEHIGSAQFLLQAMITAVGGPHLAVVDSIEQKSETSVHCSGAYEQHR